MFMLKTVDRINKMIVHGDIEQIYIGMYKDDDFTDCFEDKIKELFGSKVNIMEVDYNEEQQFQRGDCLLLYETVIRNSQYNKLIENAINGNAFIKVLTEDIFCIPRNERRDSNA